MYPPGSFLLLKMQSIDKLLQNFSPSEVLIKKTIKMISRKILVMITIVFLEDWIYKRITHLKSWPNIFKQFPSKGLVLPTWKKELLRQEPFCTTCQTTQ
jgi:hypothetical protein